MTENRSEAPPRTLPPLVITKDATTNSRRRGSLVETILDELRIGSSNQSSDKSTKKKLPRQPSAGEKKISEPKQLEAKIDKKHARRDSIKDHLLKFRIKAGKVLEEVHERLVDDHSGTPISPLTPTHSSTTVLDFQEDEISVNEERVLSPTFSQSSKKTISSDEFKASLRSKIRKQAEKVVERKRGSVQLTRRLKRRLTTHMEDMPTEHDIENVDSQIENSIKLGLRFDHSENSSSVLPSSNDQYSFCTAVFAQPNEKIENSVMVLYAKALPHSEDDAIITYTSPFVSLSELEHEIGGKHAPSSSLPHEVVDPGIKKMKNFRWEEEDLESLVYVGAEDSYNSDPGSDARYSEVNIQLDYLIASMSNDETDEDKLASHLRLKYGQLVFFVKKLSVLFESYQKTTRSNKLTALQSHRGMLDSFKDSCQSHEDQLMELLSVVDNAWKALQQQREKQGYSLTNFSIVKNEQIEEDAPRKLTLLPRLLRNHTITPLAKLPSEIRKKLETRRKRKFFITLLFNDKVVGKTRTFKFCESLCCKIGETFHMEIFSEFDVLKGNIFEKGAFTDRMVGTIDFAPPGKNVGLIRDVATFQSSRENENNALSGSLIYFISYCDREQPNICSSEQTEGVSQPERSLGFQLVPRLCRLVKDEEFESNVRWEVLERRFRMKLSSKSSDLNRIGLDSSDIDATILYNDEKKSGGGYRTGIDGHRMTANNHSVAIRRRVLENVFETSDNVQYEQIVREEPLDASFSFGNLFGPPDLSRKLKPMRKEYARQQTINISTCHLIINIQSAINLPTRSNGSLQSFVECSFQNQKIQSKPALGKHPNWQQTFRLVVDTANIDLRSITDNIEIKIYDQTVNKLDSDDREINSIHEQLLRHYIGCIKLPFSSVYSTGKIDGGIRIQFPLISTGYSAPIKGSYMKLIVALDPPMMPPMMFPNAGLDTTETNKIIGQCIAWEKSLRSQFESRRYNTTVLDVHGKRVLSSRFLRPIRPPSCVDSFSLIYTTNPKKFFELITSIVSYIPFVSDPILFSGVIDVWMSADQFISIGCGDEEEHAVLLCCWLLHLQCPSYVVLGSALPEGDKAAFVLTTNNETFFLLNPADGNVYSVDDVMCPLNSIGTVISPMNVYGNIQPFIHSSQMSFDFTKTVHWKPLFDKDVLQLESVQPASLNYTEVSDDSIMELRASIEREIKVSFDDARQFAIPQWNLMTSRILREVLQEYESAPASFLDEKLMRLRESYNITVTAIRIPYQSPQHCVHSVLSLDLHMNTDTSAQYALAVHINPYFNNIISCSIALAMLTLKR